MEKNVKPFIFDKDGKTIKWERTIFPTNGVVHPTVHPIQKNEIGCLPYTI
jgi:hypothetical protein